MDSKELIDDIREKLKEIGMSKGDVVYIASDITNLLYIAKNECDILIKDRDKFLNNLVDMFKEVVGEEGTLMFPVFSWDYCRGKSFDYKTSPGEVGALNNWILKNRQDFIRTKHPMYSFMVWGKYTHKLAAMNNQDAWSDAGPFKFLIDYHAKNLFFDIEAYKGITFVHYVEQQLKVPYRHPKYFFGDYTDKNGVTEKRCYSMYVRDWEVTMLGCITNKYLIDNGLAAGTDCHGLMLTCCDLNKTYPVLVDDMKNNNGKNTLAFENYTLDWSAPQTLPYEVKGLE